MITDKVWHDLDLLMAVAILVESSPELKALRQEQPCSREDIASITRRTVDQLGKIVDMAVANEHGLDPEVLRIARGKR